MHDELHVLMRAPG